MKVFLILPVLASLLVHMASAVQIIQRFFIAVIFLHQEVGLSFISPTSISLFRDVSKIIRVKDMMQHLKKPPFLLQSFAKLDCSCKIEFLNFRSCCNIIWTYVACTLFPTTRVKPGVRISIGLLPSFCHAFSTLCKVLQHLWVHKIEEIVVELELINLLQFFLTGGLSIVMHLIGLPFCGVFVTVGNQAAIIPIHVYGLQKAVKQLTCCHHVLLIFQLQLKIWYSYNVNNVRKTTYLVIKNTVWSCISIIWGRIGAEGQCAAEPLQVMLKIVFPLYSNEISGSVFCPFL